MSDPYDYREVVPQFDRKLDYISFGEIGGVGEMVYHTVKFKRYELDADDNGYFMRPVCQQSGDSFKNPDVTFTGQEVLASLMNLAKEINDPAATIPYTDLIEAWCLQHFHPYAIDNLYEFISDESYSDEELGFVMEKEASFGIDDFMQELQRLYNATVLYLALRDYVRRDLTTARDLYMEGRFFDIPPFFEKFKNGDHQIEHIPAKEGERLQRVLFDMIPEFRMKLAFDRYGSIVYAAVVNSVFDIAWYTFSRLVADDAPENDVDLNSNLEIGHLVSCLCCGRYMFRRNNRQRYCASPDCQAARKRKNRRDCDARKRAAKNT